MAEVNILYHKQTNSWWIDKNMDGFTFRNYMNEHNVGLGTIETNTNNKPDDHDLYEIESAFLPKWIKSLMDITEDIETNGFKNAVKVTDSQLSNLLSNLLK